MAESLTDRLARTKLGSVFLGADEEVPVPNVAKPQTTTPAMPSSFGSGASVGVAPAILSTPTFSIPTVNVDPETRNKIQFIADHVDQVSFRKFLEVKEKLEPNFGSNEASLYSTALVAMGAIGITPNEVLRGIDAILGELTRVQKEFEITAPQRIDAKVTARRQNIARIQQSRGEKQEKIRVLQETLNTLNAEIARLNQSEQAEQAAISQDEQSVKSDAEKFTVALEAVRAPYVSERQKIEFHGKGA